VRRPSKTANRVPPAFPGPPALVLLIILLLPRRVDPSTVTSVEAETLAKPGLAASKPWRRWVVLIDSLVGFSRIYPNVVGPSAIYCDIVRSCRLGGPAPPSGAPSCPP
jgi:hypothetical protein